jgi:urease accessory protein UreF
MSLFYRSDMHSNYLYSAHKVKSSFSEYEDWLKKQKQIQARREELYQTKEISQEQLQDAYEKGKAVVSAYNKMQKHTDNCVQDVSLLVDSAVLMLSAGIFKASSKIPITAAGKLGKALTLAKYILPQVLLTIPAGFKLLELPQKAGDIARFQAREKILSNSRRFIQYTPAQLAQAQSLLSQDHSGKYAQKHTTTYNPIKDIRKVFTHCLGLIKDKSAFKNWQEQFDKETQQVKDRSYINITPQQQKEAEQKQRLLLQSISKMSLRGKEYKEAILDLKDLTTLGVGIGVVHGARKTADMLSKMTRFKGIAPAIVPLAAFGTTILSGYIFGRVAKNASNVGLYSASQELLNNPQQLISFPEEEFQHLPEKELSLGKGYLMKDQIEALKRLPGIFNEYKKYRQYYRTEKQEENELYNALKDVPVSKEQYNQANHLRSDLLTSFEIIENNAQCYQKEVESLNAFGSDLLGDLVEKLFEPIADTIGISSLQTKGMLFKPLIVLPVMFALGKEPWENNIDDCSYEIGMMKGLKKLEDPRYFVHYTNEQLINAPDEREKFFQKLQALKIAP